MTRHLSFFYLADPDAYPYRVFFFDTKPSPVDVVHCECGGLLAALWEGLPSVAGSQLICGLPEQANPDSQVSRPDDIHVGPFHPSRSLHGPAHFLKRSKRPYPN